MDAPVIAQLYISHAMWGSAIASVSYRGETGESFEEAMRFHGYNPGGNAAPLPESYDDARKIIICQVCGYVFRA